MLNEAGLDISGKLDLLESPRRVHPALKDEKIKPEQPCLGPSLLRNMSSSLSIVHVQYREVLKYTMINPPVEEKQLQACNTDVRDNQ